MKYFLKRLISKKTGTVIPFLSLLVSLFQPIVLARTHQYTVSMDDSLKYAKVDICFDGKAPDYLAVDYKKATKNLLAFPKVSRGHIEFQGRYWKTDNLAKNACIKYRADISAHIYRGKNKIAKASKVSFQGDNTWLWLPEKLVKGESAEIVFNIPDNYQVSSPWTLLDAKEKRFRIGDTPHDWGFTLIIGEIQFLPVTLSKGSRLNIALMPGVEKKNLLTRWVIDIAENLSNYIGAPLATDVQVILLENNHFTKGVVPWGDVKRGGGLGVRFVVDSHKAIDEFYADWTASHEFSHLLLPNISYNDIWLSEGLASYLQYILMAQSGEITEQQAWTRMYQGFVRGEKGTLELGETLAETSERRRLGARKARTMKVYWSGAAYFLLADWQLRKRSEGQVGLEDILLKLNRCCISNSVEWSGLELATKLDELSSTSIFSDLYLQTAESKEFPDYKSVFDSIGVNIISGQVSLSKAVDSAYRSAIMQKTTE